MILSDSFLFNVSIILLLSKFQYQVSSPACTELEVIMMNWLGKLLDLPKEFLNSSDGPGGGVIQVSGTFLK